MNGGAVVLFGIRLIVTAFVLAVRLSLTAGSMVIALLGSTGRGRP